MNLKQKPRCSFHVAHGPPNIVWLSQAFNAAFYLWNLLWQTVWDVYLMLLYLIAKKFWNVLQVNLFLLLKTLQTGAGGRRECTLIFKFL